MKNNVVRETKHITDASHEIELCMHKCARAALHPDGKWAGGILKFGKDQNSLSFRNLQKSHFVHLCKNANSDIWTSSTVFYIIQI